MKQLSNIISKIVSNPIKSILLISILLRIVLFFLYQHISYFPDSSGYIYLTKRLSLFDLHEYQGDRSPGYPLLLLFGLISPYLVILLQSIIGIINNVFLYKNITLVGVHSKIGLFISLLVCLYIPAIFFEFSILSESLTFFCVNLSFYFYLKLAQQKNSFKGIFSLAIVTGYLVLIKPFYIFLPTLYFIFLIIPKRKDYGFRINYCVLIAIPLFIFVSWCFINYLNTGYFVPTTFYGYNLAQNCVSFAERTSTEYFEIGRIYAKYREINIQAGKNTAMSIWDAYGDLENQTGLSFTQLSERLYNYSKATIKLNPLLYAKQVCVSWLDFWKTTLYLEYDNFGIQQAITVVKYVTNVERLIFQVLKVIFVLLIPYNIVMTLRKRKLSCEVILSLIILMASILQAISTYGTNSRFSFPFEYLILISVTLNIRLWLYSK